MFRIAAIIAVLIAGLSPVMAAKLHPRCNIDWPCQVFGSKEISLRANKNGHKSSFLASEEITPRVTKRQAREARRIARGQRLEQAMPFGKALAPGESAASFIRGRLVCARNIGAELARRGLQGTGSALAKSYLSWGRPSGPVRGAIAVFSRGKRGGHVAIVDSVRPDGTVIYLNPSSRRQAWQVGPYNRRPIAFRVAG